ncbi:MAG: NYN domain-containing protein [Planctomycetota bacterium]
MKGRVVFLLDGGFIRKQLKPALGRRPEADDVVAMVDHILKEPLLAGTELLRVFYYDAPPLATKETHPISSKKVNFASTEQGIHGLRLIRQLELKEPYAVRLGETRMPAGRWTLKDSVLRELVKSPRKLQKDDVLPGITQKGVDLRLGLDIAWISLKRLAETIVIVTGDADFLPALKFARKEGARVVLCPLGWRPRRELLAHADYVLDGVKPERFIRVD